MSAAGVVVYWRLLLARRRAARARDLWQLACSPQFGKHWEAVPERRDGLGDVVAQCRRNCRRPADRPPALGARPMVPDCRAGLLRRYPPEFSEHIPVQRGLVYHPSIQHVRAGSPGVPCWYGRSACSLKGTSMPTHPCCRCRSGMGRRESTTGRIPTSSIQRQLITRSTRIRRYHSSSSISTISSNTTMCSDISREMHA